MDAPAFNFASPLALTGLCYRALAADADPQQATITMRRLDHVRMADTGLLESRSTLRSDVDILAQKELDAREEAQRLALDLRLYNEAYPPAARKRGLLGKRPTPEQQAHEAKRRELIMLAEQAGQLARERRQQLDAARRQLEETSGGQAEVDTARAEILAQLQEQLAAQVLSLLAAGDTAGAQRALELQRQNVRGQLMVGVLHVLTAWLGEGADAARAALLDMRSIFSQYPDPAVRTLEGLLIVSGGEPLSAQELGLSTRDSFTLPGLGRLYQLLRVLAGRAPDEQSLAGDAFYPALWIIHQYKLALRGEEDKVLAPVPLAQWAAGGDTVVRALACNLLLRIGADALIPLAAGVDINSVQPPRRANETWPPLLKLLPHHIPAWPSAHAAAWQAALACHVLYSASEQAPAPLYESWLAESYGWPKSDMYWWTLAMVKKDMQLLANVSGAESELLAVAP